MNINSSVIYIIHSLAYRKKTYKNLKSFAEDIKDDLFGLTQVSLKGSKNESEQEPTQKQKQKNKNQNPFALVLHAYAAAATYAKARVGLGQLTSEGSKWKLTSDLCFWLLQRKGKRGSEGRV
jgi:hypothetical protein